MVLLEIELMGWFIGKKSFLVENGENRNSLTESDVFMEWQGKQKSLSTTNIKTDLFQWQISWWLL